MFKNVLLVLSALLASTGVMAQCGNNACDSANADYKACKYGFTTQKEFKKCLCTDKFLVNYQRCLSGTICAWDGTPETLHQGCVKIYCAGTFSGGFDAVAYCTSGSAPTASIKSTQVTPLTLTYSPIPIETGIA